MTPKLQVIIGSTRPNRNADAVADWIVEGARDHGGFEVEVVDLRDWQLPMFVEHVGSLGDPADPTYSSPIVKEWNAKIAEGDCYLFVTPEYNHSIPGELKNAIDSVFASFAFRHKPLTYAAYSAGIAAGARAVEQLALIAIEAEMVPLRNSVLVPFVREAFDSDGKPNDTTANHALTVALDDLHWWAQLLAPARETQLEPGGFRLRDAIAQAAGGS